MSTHPNNRPIASTPNPLSALLNIAAGVCHSEPDRPLLSSNAAAFVILSVSEGSGITGKSMCF